AGGVDGQADPVRGAEQRGAGRDPRRPGEGQVGDLQLALDHEVGPALADIWASSARWALIHFIAYSSCPSKRSEASTPRRTSGINGLVIAHVRPAYIATGRNAALTVGRSGRPNDTLDAPHVMLLSSSSRMSFMVASVIWPASGSAAIDESMHTGASVTSHTALIAATSNAGSSAIGMPALMSSMCAPAATCAMASVRTRSMRPSFISAASTLRPVGLMRSPMITKGRSPEMTTSRPREERRVSKALALSQRLVDLHDGLFERLGTLRLTAAVTDKLLGHARRHRGIRRIAVGAHVLRVFLRHRRTPDRDVDLVAQPGLRERVDVGFEHRHGRGQE